MIHLPIGFLIQHPRITAVISLVLTLACGAATVMTALDTASQPSEPARLSFAEAVDKAYEKPGAQIWVVIEDGGEYDCDTLRHTEVGSSEQTEVFLTDSARETIVLATFTKPYTCDEIKQQPVTGFLYTMSDRRVETFREEFPTELAKYENASRMLGLCTICSKSNSFGLQVIFGVLTLGSLLLYPLVRYANRKQNSGPASQS